MKPGDKVLYRGPNDVLSGHLATLREESPAGSRNWWLDIEDGSVLGYDGSVPGYCNEKYLTPQEEA